MTDVAIEARALSRRYGRRWALANVSFTVPRGSIVMLAGRNGSGKSTLLRVLATAIRADAGTAIVDGLDVRTDPDAVRRRTALLGHHTNTYEALSALENLAVTARLLGRPATTDAVAAVLEEAGLAGRGDDPVATFSAGMRKRLSIARVLLQDEARVVFLDEPYNQLDPPGIALVDRLLARFRSGGITVVLATHLIERGAGLCDRAIVLEQGRLAWEGPAAGIGEARVLEREGIA